MGLEQVSEQGGISPSGESAETSIPNRSIWRLHWFVDKLLHLHLPFSLPSIDEIKQIIGRGILTAGAVGTPFLGVTPQAYAEGQPGVKREGITDTFNPASEPNGINIELGEDGVPEVYVPSQESTIIVVDGNPVEASGVRDNPSVGGEPPFAEQPNPVFELTAQESGDPASPDAGAAEAPSNALKLKYTSPKGFLTIDNSYPDDPTKQPTDGFNPGLPETLEQWDAFLGKYNIHLSFSRNPNLKSARMGSYSIYLDKEGKQLYGILRPTVSVEDRTIKIEFNNLMPNQQVTLEFLAEQSRLTGGAITGEMAKIVYGKSIDQAIEESQAELQRVTRLNPELFNTVQQPIQLVAATTPQTS